MTAVADGVVVTAQNGRIFRLAPGVLNCAQDLLAGVDPAQIASFIRSPSRRCSPWVPRSVTPTCSRCR